MKADRLPLFVYGTLQDGEILALVLGRKVPPRALLPARLTGWRVVYYPGELYPALVAAKAGQAEGLVIAGLSRRDLERLDGFEGDQYRREAVHVDMAGGMVAAQAYFPTRDIGPDAPEWTLESWQRYHRPAVIAQYRADGFL